LQCDSKRLINHTAATTASGWAHALSPAGAATSHNQRLHGEQLPRIGNAREWPLYGRGDLPT
jgi:hypothetical protein